MYAAIDLATQRQDMDHCHALQTEDVDRLDSICYYLDNRLLSSALVTSYRQMRQEQWPRR